MSVPIPRVRQEKTLTAPNKSSKANTGNTSNTGNTGGGSGAAPKMRAVNTRLASFVSEDYFGHQPTTTDALPDPTLLAENLARSVLEILAGARELDQIARWVTDEVYQHLLKRVHISQRARTLKNLPAHRPSFTVGRTLVSHPAEGVVEAVVIIHGKARSRSVAIRLEGMDNRWRASAVHVL